MSIGIVSAAYISAAILFILSLGGLSNQESAKRAVWYGIVGMALAVFATVFGPGSGTLWLVILMFAIAAVIGWQVATRVQMTEMPQLVAALHSFVGLAAVLIGFNAHLELAAVQAMDEAARAALTGFAGVLAHKTGVEIAILKVEVFLGVFIGAVTFTGSIIAFGKLAGKVDGKAEEAARRPYAERRRGGDLARAAAHLPRGRRDVGAYPDDAARLLHRLPPHHGDRRRRHARRRVDAEQLFGLGGVRHRLHARQRPADRDRRARRLLGRDPVLHHVQGDEPLVHLGHPRRLRQHDRPGAGDRGRADRHRHRRRRGVAQRGGQRHHRAGLRHGGGAGAAGRGGTDPQAAGGGQGTCASRSTRSPAACPGT